MCRLVNPKSVHHSLRTPTTLKFLSLVCPAAVPRTVHEVSRRLNCRKRRRHHLRSIGGTSASAIKRPCQKTERRDIIGEGSAVGSRPSCIGATVLVSRDSISTTSLLFPILNILTQISDAARLPQTLTALGCYLLRSTAGFHRCSNLQVSVLIGIRVCKKLSDRQP